MNTNEKLPDGMDAFEHALRALGADEEARIADPPPIEDLARIHRRRTLRNRAITLGFAVAATGVGWLALPQILNDNDNALDPAGSDNTPVVTDEYSGMDKVPLTSEVIDGVPLIVMAELPDGITDEGFHGKLIQDAASGCLMMQSESGDEPRATIVWPPRTTVTEGQGDLRVVFESGVEITLGDSFSAGESLKASTVQENIDADSPCIQGEFLLAMIDPSM